MDSVFRSTAASVAKWAADFEVAAGDSQFPVLDTVADSLYAVTHNKIFNATLIATFVEAKAAHVFDSIVNTANPQPFSAMLYEALAATKLAVVAWLKIFLPVFHVVLNILASIFVIIRSVLSVCLRASLPYLRKGLARAYKWFGSIDDGTRHAILLSLLAIAIAFLLRRHIAKQKYIPRFLLWVQNHKARARRRYEDIVQSLRAKSRVLAAIFPHILSLGGVILFNWALPDGVRKVFASPVVLIASGVAFPLFSGWVAVSLVEQNALGAYTPSFLRWSNIQRRGSLDDSAASSNSNSNSSSSSSSGASESASGGGLRRRKLPESTRALTAEGQGGAAQPALASQLMPDESAFGSIPEHRDKDSDADSASDTDDVDDDGLGDGQGQSRSRKGSLRRHDQATRSSHKSARKDRSSSTKDRRKADDEGQDEASEGESSDSVDDRSADSDRDNDDEGASRSRKANERGRGRGRGGRRDREGVAEDMDPASQTALMRTATQLTEYYVSLGLLVGAYGTFGIGHALDYVWTRAPLAALLLLWWMQNGGSSLIVSLLLRGGLRQLAGHKSEGPGAEGAAVAAAVAPVKAQLSQFAPLLRLLPVSISGRLQEMQANGSLFVLPCAIFLITPAFLTTYAACFVGLVRPAIAAALAIDAFASSSAEMLAVNDEYEDAKRAMDAHAKAASMRASEAQTPTLVRPGGDKGDGPDAAGDEAAAGDSNASGGSGLSRVFSMFTPSKFFSKPKPSPSVGGAATSGAGGRGGGSALTDKSAAAAQLTSLNAVSDRLRTAMKAERVARKDLHWWLRYYALYIGVRCVLDASSIQFKIGFEAHLLLLVALYFQLLDGAHQVFRIIRRLPFVSVSVSYARATLFADQDDAASAAGGRPSAARAAAVAAGDAADGSERRGAGALDVEAGVRRINSAASARVVSQVLAGILSPAIALPRSSSTGSTSKPSSSRAASRTGSLSQTARPVGVSNSVSSASASSITQSARVGMPPGGHEQGRNDDKPVGSGRSLSRIPQASKRQWEKEGRERDRSAQDGAPKAGDAGGEPENTNDAGDAAGPGDADPVNTDDASCPRSK